MKERTVTIQNKAGIHCRPSGVILKAIDEEFSGNRFTLETADGRVSELGGILDLISLCLTQGSSAILRVEGPDEEKAVQRIGDLFEFRFDFPPQTRRENAGGK